MSARPLARVTGAAELAPNATFAWAAQLIPACCAIAWSKNVQAPEASGYPQVLPENRAMFVPRLVSYCFRAMRTAPPPRNAANTICMLLPWASTFANELADESPISACPPTRAFITSLPFPYSTTRTMVWHCFSKSPKAPIPWATGRTARTLIGWLSANTTVLGATQFWPLPVPGPLDTELASFAALPQAVAVVTTAARTAQIEWIARICTLLSFRNDGGCRDSCPCGRRANRLTPRRSQRRL